MSSLFKIIFSKFHPVILFLRPSLQAVPPLAVVASLVSLGFQGSVGEMVEMGLREKKDLRGHQERWAPRVLRVSKASQVPKGNPVPRSLIRKNWKQCAWKNINDDRDYGLIKVRKKRISRVILSAAKQLQKQVRPQRLYYFVESEMKSSFDRSFF